MSHPVSHAESSARLFGGRAADYQKIHDWMDATKETFADFRHRALRHHSQGIFECERVFGKTIRVSRWTIRFLGMEFGFGGRRVPVRYVAEQHVKEDCGGVIPTVADWFRNIKKEPWMARGYRIEPRRVRA